MNQDDIAQQLIIQPNGQIRCFYSEVIELASLGPLTITRASHVEPDCHGQWWADLSPVQGPQLGPFLVRSAALQAESAWLEEHRLSTSND